MADRGNDIAIKVEHVSKTFKLPHERTNSIKGALINFAKHTRGYEKQHVLNDISFEIKEGEFFGIVGRNGSGKSTLLKLLAGIYTPDKGDIQINGKLTPFIELGVGFNHELTGRENVFLNGSLLGFSRKEMLAMYQDIVEFAELGRFMDQKLKNYSSGMQVRLAFSIAIRTQSDILLIDEVLAVGDAAFQKKCFDVFRELKNKGKTIILVTHDMSSVERFCNRVLVLDKGRILDIVEAHQAASMYSRINIDDTQKVVPHKDKTPKASNRWGVGGITVKDIALLRANKKTTVFEVGDPLTIRISLSRNKQQRNTPIVCGLAFYNQDGVNIGGPNSKFASIKPSATEIIATLPSVQFAAGEYSLTIAIFDDNVVEPFDFLDKYQKFSVVSGHAIHGAMELPMDWSSSSL